ncbi:MAG: sporulation integral membrane protein YtvI, partial [Clostridia bacterium]|nr:sporulation integral membrane protein YtvI [Clostridia bacterium]
DTVNKIAEWVDSSLADLLVFFSNTATNMVKGLTKIPQIFFACIITILATFFFLVDRHKLYQHMRRHIPEKWLSFMVNMYKTFIHALVGWIRAQLIIMLCLGTVILIGLLILHVNYAFLIALAIALLDALPLFGSAAVLLPWSVYCLFTGAVGRGIGLAVIYLCAVVTRQLIEPRIVGQQIGIHPLLTLTAMYAGFVVAGVLGLILGPMLMLLLKYVISAYLNGRTYKEAVYGSTDEGVQKAQLLRQSAVEEQLRGKTIKE